MTFGYYLRLTFEPNYYTLTWTLDYQYSSDFGKSRLNFQKFHFSQISFNPTDDSTGHWQVMPHPTKR